MMHGSNSFNISGQDVGTKVMTLRGVPLDFQGVWKLGSGKKKKKKSPPKAEKFFFFYSSDG